jgi:hypothetical protein
VARRTKALAEYRDYLRENDLGTLNKDDNKIL